MDSVSPQSHVALKNAYDDLKKRYNELQTRHEIVLNQLKKTSSIAGDSKSIRALNNILQNERRQSWDMTNGEASFSHTFGDVDSLKREIHHLEKQLEESEEQCNGLTQRTHELPGLQFELREAQDRSMQLMKENDKLVRENMTLERKRAEQSFDDGTFVKVETEDIPMLAKQGDLSMSMELEPLLKQVIDYEKEMVQLRNIVKSQKRVIQSLAGQPRGKSVKKDYSSTNGTFTNGGIQALGQGARPKTRTSSSSSSSLEMTASPFQCSEEIPAAVDEPVSPVSPLIPVAVSRHHRSVFKPGKRHSVPAFQPPDADMTWPSLDPREYEYVGQLKCTFRDKVSNDTKNKQPSYGNQYSEPQRRASAFEQRERLGGTVDALEIHYDPTMDNDRDMESEDPPTLVSGLPNRSDSLEHLGDDSNDAPADSEQPTTWNARNHKGNTEKYRTYHISSSRHPRATNPDRNDSDSRTSRSDITTNHNVNMNSDSRLSKYKSTSSSHHQALNNNAHSGYKSTSSHNIHSTIVADGTPVDLPRTHYNSEVVSCPICNCVLGNQLVEDRQKHVNNCIATSQNSPSMDRECPICQMKFPTTYTQEEINQHANNHFEKEDPFELLQT